jgi:hypothetical protein
MRRPEDLGPRLSARSTHMKFSATSLGLPHRRPPPPHRRVVRDVPADGGISSLAFFVLLSNRTPRGATVTASTGSVPEKNGTTFANANGVEGGSRVSIRGRS